MSAKFIDITGNRYGKLVVQQLAESHVYPDGRKSKQWVALCDCGNVTTVFPQNLKSGATRSCGCGKRESRPAKIKVPEYVSFNGERYNLVKVEDNA